MLADLIITVAILYGLIASRTGWVHTDRVSVTCSFEAIPGEADTRSSRASCASRSRASSRPSSSPSCTRPGSVSYSCGNEISPRADIAVIAPGSLFCGTLMAIQNKFYTVGLFFSLNSRNTFAPRNITLDFGGSVSWEHSDLPQLTAAPSGPCLCRAAERGRPADPGDRARRRRDGDVRGCKCT